MADTKEIINCPACGTKMQKVFINTQGFYLDICTECCGGILFDNREFKCFDEQNEDISEIEQALEGKIFKKQDESQKRICPICHSNMVKNFASSLREVEIDECYNCGVKFLDGGELQKIRAQFKTEKERSDKFNQDFNVAVKNMSEKDDANYSDYILNNSESAKSKSIISSIIDILNTRREVDIEAKRNKTLEKINENDI